MFNKSDFSTLPINYLFLKIPDFDILNKEVSFIESGNSSIKYIRVKRFNTNSFLVNSYFKPISKYFEIRNYG